MFKSYYASILIAVGAALLIAAPENWMLQIVAYALLSGGALMQQSASRWYFRASVAADAMILLTILGGTPVLGPGLVHIILSYVGDAVQWILGCLLFCAFGAVMRATGKKAALARHLLSKPWIRHNPRKAGQTAGRSGLHNVQSLYHVFFEKKSQFSHIFFL